MIKNILQKKLKETENYDFIKELDETYEHVGFSVKTVPRNGKQKTIHETNKKINIDVQIINKKEFKILQEFKALGMEPYCKSANPFKGTLLVAKDSKILFGKTILNCYSEEHGYTTTDKIQNLDKYFRIEFTDKEINDMGSLEIEWFNRKKNFDEIAKIFEIDAKKYMYDGRLMCRAILKQNLINFKGAEHVTYTEFPFINGACQGAMMYAKSGIYKSCWKYDINSMYPYLMTHPNFYFPLSEGIITTITKIDKKKFGIYKLKILSNHRLFKETADGYYTNYHVKLMDILDVKYKLASFDALIFDSVADSELLFGYFNDLFELKRNGNTHAKEIMNMTWGGASKKKTYTMTLEELDEADAYDRVVRMYVEKGYAIVMDSERPFKHVTARLKPFLMSFVRLLFVQKILKPVLDAGYEIHQINTDGFVSNIPPCVMTKIRNISKELGDLKIEEEYETCNVVHVRKVLKITS
jgi:hypothetical protein